MSFYSRLLSKIIQTEEVESFRKQLLGKKVVFTNGCFDLLHPGHVEYLARARDLGDFLWIGVNSDESVSRLKGPGRPINKAEDRAKVLAGLACVDGVTTFSEDTPLLLLSKVKPNIHTKGGDYTKETLPEYPLILSMGGEVVILPFLEGKSTTSILEKAKTSI
ncbi:D-glycero-beta-D-manno-heptose 1-phosphate adenylyltransferase [Leptospira ognonensis]|uniref:D-glycero-beta-D-manno-heptose 1-phosphate adenylyltransferase n=1 Tax=Leptospira ognonensis TaxID=2484945 RepID=A0A4R9JWJ8_9LEPT|nr:D-glycero-beta-D-manno-heptose 1-phosphate adenylyltransferase [Leptospira ognonensis]TGL57394.1 D-glycero-beta-D-manno-heptose 1-phosphate adenylyltransferase [Leptospira ognonensis]